MLKLRLAEMHDWARLGFYRNDPVTRAMFLETEPITLREHMAWLKKALADKAMKLYIARDATRSANVGTGRLMRHKVAAREVVEFSLTVDPRHRGQGYAEQIIAALSREHAISTWAKLPSVALVKADNWPSLLAFAECGFSPVSYDDEFVTLEPRA